MKNTRKENTTEEDVELKAVKGEKGKNGSDKSSEMGTFETFYELTCGKPSHSQLMK